MDISELLSNIPSGKERALYIESICVSKKDFEDLLEAIYHLNDPRKWRAAWILDGCDEKNPGIAENYISRIINELDTLHSMGTLRSMLRLLSRYEIPAKQRGRMLDKCFSYMQSELYPVAVKVYAMQIVYNLSRIYPELRRELALTIEEQIENNSAGFRARGNLILKQMQRNQ